MKKAIMAAFFAALAMMSAGAFSACDYEERVPAPGQSVETPDGGGTQKPENPTPENPDDNPEEEPQKTIHTVTFINGNTTSSQKVEEGKTVTLPGVSEKDGYDFIGWFSNDKLWEENTPVTESITLRASFEALFTMDGGEIFDFTSYGKSHQKSHLIIPEKIDGVTVTSIGGWAFENATATRLSIPKTVTSIGDSAFADMVNCKTVEFLPKNCADLSPNHFAFLALGENTSGVQIIFGKDVRRVPAYLFQPYSYDYHPANIASVTFAENAVCEEIGNNAFNTLSALSSVSLPQSLKTVGSSAFHGCNALSSINLDRVAHIDERAFEYTNIQGTKLSSLQTAEQYAFYNCKKITEVELPLLQKIPATMFYACDNLKTVKIGDQATSVGAMSFAYCKKLETLSIGKNVTIIGHHAFDQCESLLSLVIPDKVETVAMDAFSGCNALKSLSLGKGLKEIDSKAFYNCTSLTYLHFQSVPQISSDAFYGFPSNAEIYFYGTEQQWQSASLISGLRNIENVYFYSSTQPSISGAYWYYDQNGAVKKW